MSAEQDAATRRIYGLVPRLTREEVAAMNGHVDLQRRVEASREVEPFFEPQRDPPPRWMPLFYALVIAFSLFLLWWGIESICHMAQAHIADHPEWDDVLGNSKDLHGNSCCGMGDAHILEYDEWKENPDGSYQVFVEGEWRDVPKGSVTSNTVNVTGHAIVWWSKWSANEGGHEYSGIAVYCIKPLDTY